MVERYSREQMAQKWNMQAKYTAWLEVEKAAVKAWNKLGFISDADCEKICKNAKFDVARIDEIEKTDQARRDRVFNEREREPGRGEPLRALRHD